MKKQVKKTKNAQFSIVNVTTDKNKKPCLLVETSLRLEKDDFLKLRNDITLAGGFMFGAKVDGKYRSLCVSKLDEKTLNSLLLSYKWVKAEPKVKAEKPSAKKADILAKLSPEQIEAILKALSK